MTENHYDLKRFCEKYEPEIQAGLVRFLPSESEISADFIEKARLPITDCTSVLALLGGAIFGETPEKLISTACAVEYIRIAGLLFNDIGSGGKMFEFEDKLALTHGLSLLNSSYSLVFVEHFDKPERAAQAHQEIVECIAAGGLIGGLAGLSFEENLNDAVFRQKTSPALTRLSLRLGAILAGADYMDLANFSRIAEILSEAQSIRNNSLLTSTSLEEKPADRNYGDLKELVLTAKRQLLENFPSNEARSCLIQFAESLSD